MSARNSWELVDQNYSTAAALDLMNPIHKKAIKSKVFLGSSTPSLQKKENCRDNPKLHNFLRASHAINIH